MRLPASSRTPLTRAICLMLCVATWRGPVVWVHEHADHEEDVLLDAKLARHLRRYHDESSDVAKEPTWHFHVGFMRDLLTGDCEDESPDPTPDGEPINLVEATNSVSARLVSVAPQRAAIFESIAPATTIFAPAPLEAVPVGCFLQSHSHVPLRVLIRVALC